MSRRQTRSGSSRAPPAPVPPPPPPQPEVEQPRAAWQDRRLGYETFFPLEDFFAHAPGTEYSRQQIRRYRLEQLCQAPWPVYPRLVRLFYQNLRTIRHEPLTFETFIDGQHILISPAVVSRAAGLHLHRPADLRHQRRLPPFHELATDICSQQVFPRETHTLRRYVHPDDLLLDTVIWRNVFPHGNKQERRSSQLAPLYCAHHDLWFDYGRLICQSIEYFWNGAHRTQRASSKRWLLPHAGLISAILTTSSQPTIDPRPQYEIRLDEPRDTHREVYEPLTWTKTTAHLFVSSSESEADDADDDEDDVAPAAAPAPAAAEVPPPGGFLMLPPPRAVLSDRYPILQFSSSTSAVTCGTISFD